MNKRNIFFIFRNIVVVVFLFCSCTTIKKNVFSLTGESYCAPQRGEIPHDPYNISQNADSILQQSKFLQNRYSQQSILIIYALNIYDDIVKLEQLRGDSVTIALLMMKQNVYSKLAWANSAIDATAAELDCEGERIGQLAKYIDNLNAKRVTKLAVASIVVGAISGIAGALITNSDWNDGVAIGAGIAGVGLGLATLNPKGKKVELQHKRNLLRDVWTEKNTDDIPGFIWFMLTQKQFSNIGNGSILGHIKQRWVEYQFDGNTNSAVQSVNFSNGGTYRADDLHDREDMINQLQAAIRSLKQNINQVQREIN